MGCEAQVVYTIGKLSKSKNARYEIRAVDNGTEKLTGLEKPPNDINGKLR